MPVKVMVVGTPSEAIEVSVGRPEWQQYLEY